MLCWFSVRLVPHSTGYSTHWVLVSAWVCVTMGNVYFTSAKGRGDWLIFDPCIVSWCCCPSTILGLFLPKKKKKKERERRLPFIFFNLHLINLILPRELGQTAWRNSGFYRFYRTNLLWDGQALLCRCFVTEEFM